MTIRLSDFVHVTAEQLATDCVIDIAARAGHYVVVSELSGGYDDRNITQPARVESPVGTVKWKYPIHGADGLVTNQIYGPGTAVRVVLPSGGAGKTGWLNVLYRYLTELQDDL